MSAIHTMFGMHMRQCQEFCTWDSDNMVRAATMVALSIQQKWDQVGGQLKSVLELGDKSPYLWGHKQATYAYINEWKHELYTESMARRDDMLSLLDLWSSVPGLGMVKAGFMLQLMFGEVGCIDSHNAEFYGIEPGQLRLDGKLTVRTRTLKLSAYLQLCEQLGGSEYLWRQWCINLADRYPDVYDDQYDVSARHIEYLRGEA